MNRGGARPGAGRKKQEPTVSYHRRVKPEWVDELDKKIEELKKLSEHKKTEQS